MMYQYSWNVCLFINDSTCGSCMMEQRLIFPSSPESTWNRLSIDSEQDMEFQSTGLHDLLTSILWAFPVGPPKDFCAFKAAKWLGGFKAMSRECSSGDSSKTRNFRKKYALLWDVELTVVLACMRTTLSICCGDDTNITYISAGTAVGHLLVGHICLFKYTLRILKACNHFLNILCI